MAHPRGELRATVALLGLNSDEAQALLAAVTPVARDDCMRGVFAGQFESIVGDASPDALARYRAFAEHLPRVAPFSWMWLGDFVLLLARAASLLYPEQPLVDACNCLILEQHQRLGQIATVQTLVKAAEGDLEACIRQIFLSLSLFQTFSENDIEETGEPNALLVHASETWTAASLYFLRGFYSGLFALFGKTGTVEVYDTGPRSFTFQLRWR